MSTTTAPRKPAFRTDEELVALAVELERTEAKLRDLKDKAHLLEADLIDALRVRGMDFIQHHARGRACLEVPQTRSIDPQRFIEFCRKLEKDPEEVDRCLKRSVLIGQAKRILDEDELASIVTLEPGNARIAFKETLPESADGEA